MNRTNRKNEEPSIGRDMRYQKMTLTGPAPS